MKVYTSLPLHIFTKDADIADIKNAIYIITKALSEETSIEETILVDSFDDVKDLPDNPNGRARGLSLICQNLVGIDLIISFNYDIDRCERPVDIDFELDTYWKSIMMYHQLDERAIDMITGYSREEIPTITIPISFLKKVMER